MTGTRRNVLISIEQLGVQFYEDKALWAVTSYLIKRLSNRAEKRLVKQK